MTGVSIFHLLETIVQLRHTGMLSSIHSNLKKNVKSAGVNSANTTLEFAKIDAAR
jgi:hypothetical protein